MTILADWQIEEVVRTKQMIEPFTRKKVSSEPGPSYGLSSYGYDIKLGDTFTRWYGDTSLLLDPDDVDEEDTYTKVKDEYFVLAAQSFVLAHSLEHFVLPSNVTGLVKDKSSYARCGIALQNTVLEAGWHGQITLEITNHNSRPVKLYIGAGIAQVLFFRGLECSNPYDGKYQHQQGVVLPRK